MSGATGNVGRLVVEQALARGHEVVALARNPQNLQREHPNLTTGAVDILDAQTLKPWLQGVDAVISTVGIGTSKTPTTLYSAGTKNLLDAMQEHGVSRLVVISSEVAEHWAHQGLFKLWVVLPLLQHFLGATYDDMRRMDVVLWESTAQWTAVRAPRIQPDETQRLLSARCPQAASTRLDDYPSRYGYCVARYCRTWGLNRQHVYVAN